MTVAEMKKELIEKYGCDRKEVNKLSSKGDVQEYYRKITEDFIAAKTLQEDVCSNKNIDVVKVVETQYGDDNNNFENIVINNENEISNYLTDVVETTQLYKHDDILKLFHESELESGNPKVNGLRRVAAIVIGNIINQKVELQHFDFGEYHGVSCVFSTSFLCNNQNFGVCGEIITITDAADCIPEYNANNYTFSKYMTALATTRAEARVLRKALRLNVVAAEEMENFTEDNNFTTSKIFDQKITDVQKQALKRAAENVGAKIIDGKLDGFDKKIEDYTDSEYKRVIKQLNDCGKIG